MTQLSAMPSLSLFGGEQFGIPGLGRPTAPKEDYSVTPGEEQSYLGKTLGFLEGAGNTLDTPGAAVRGGLYGAITGDWSGLNSNVTNATGRKYGSDFVDLAGFKEPERWAGQEDETFNPFNQSQPSAYGDVDTYANTMLKLTHKALGLAGDIVTDPLSLIGVGGKTAQGLAKIAEAGHAMNLASVAAKGGDFSKILEGFDAGKFAKNLASSPVTAMDEFRNGDRAMLGLHLPFWAGSGEKPLLPIWGSGGLGGETAAKMAGWAGYNPVTRLFRGLFSSQVSPEVTRFATGAQMANDALYHHRDQLMSNAEAASGAFAKAYPEIEKGLQDIIDHHVDSGNITAAQDIIRDLSTNKSLADAGGNLDAVKNALNEHLRSGGQKDDPLGVLEKVNEWSSRFYDYQANLEQFKDSLWKKAMGLGLKSEDLVDAYVEHMPRGTSLKNYIEDMKPWKNRNEASRNIVGGEAAINEAAQASLAHGYVEPGADLSRFGKLVEKGYDPETGRIKASLWKAMLEEVTVTEPGTKNLQELRGQYLYDHVFKNQVDRAWADKTEAMRDSATGKIIPDKTTGVYQDFVKILSDGTPVDYAHEKSRWDPLSFRTPTKTGEPGPINENHPILKLIDWLDGFTDKDELGRPAMFKAGIYDQNLAKDVQRYSASLTRRIATLQSAHNWIGQEGALSTAGPSGWRSLRDAWKAADLNPESLDAFVSNKYGNEIAQNAQDAFQRATQSGLKTTIEKETTKASKAITDDLTIHPKADTGLSVYADMARTGMRTPELLKIWDRYNTTFKNLLYNIWPASHVRDLLSRVWNASVAGKAPVTGILGSTIEAFNHFKNLGRIDYETPEFIREFQESGLFKNFTADMVQSRPGLWRANKIPEAGFWSSISPFNKGGVKWGGPLFPDATGLKGKIPNPIPAIPGIVSDEAAAAGKKINNFVLAGMGAQSYGDAVGQMGYFGALRKAGYTTEQSKHLVQEAFYTLGEQTPFEKHFLQRVMPFERFTARNVPYQLMKLGMEPGGATAQTTRALVEGSQDKDYKPEFLRESTAFPLGQAKPGEQQAFYRNTLIPLHELNDIVLGRGVWGDVTRTGEKIMSRFNPLLSAFIERPWSPEGTQLYTGRKNKDLGYNWLENLTRFTPASRMLSTAEQVPGFSAIGQGVSQLPGGQQFLKDTGLQHQGRPAHSESVPEFMANLLGLGRVANYDTQHFKEADLRNSLTDIAKERGAKGVEDLFIPVDVHKQQTPQEQAELKQMLKRRTGIIRRMAAERNSTSPVQTSAQLEGSAPSAANWPGLFGG